APQTRCYLRLLLRIAADNASRDAVVPGYHRRLTHRYYIRSIENHVHPATSPGWSASKPYLGITSRLSVIRPQSRASKRGHSYIASNSDKPTIAALSGQNRVSEY